MQHFSLFSFVRYCSRLCTVPRRFLFHLVIHLSHAFRGFVLSGLENSPCPPKKKGRHSDPSVDRIIEIIRQLEQVFESYRIVFKEMKEKINHFDDDVSAKKVKAQKTKLLLCGVGGRRSIIP